MYYNYIMRIYKLNFAFNKSLKYLYKYHYYYLHIFILLIINLRMFKQRFYSLTISILIYWLYVYRCVFFVKKNAWMSILLLWASGFTQPRESVVFKHNLRVNLVLIHLIIINMYTHAIWECTQRIFTRDICGVNVMNIDYERLSRAVSSVYSHVLSPSSVILCLTFIPVLAYIDLSFMWE